MFTVNLVLDRRYQYPDHSYSIKVRITYKRQFFDKSTPIKIQDKFWCKKMRQIKSQYPDHQFFNAEIESYKLNILKSLLSYVANKTDFSLSDLKSHLNPKQTTTRFIDYTKQRVEFMIKSKRIGNANSYKSFKTAFIRYFPKTDSSLQNITFNQVVEFELNMIKHGLSTNGIASYMRTFRAIYNSAIKEGVLTDNNNPFKKYSIKTESTVNKYLTQKELSRILNYKPINPQMELALDLILSMFYLIGINFKDLLQLKWTDISNNTISYKRSKTHKIYNIIILDQLSTIFKKYKVNRSKYIFPILSDDYNQLEDYKIIKNRTKTFNKNFCKITGSKVSSYYIRYTWANTAKKLGFSNDMIAEALGHSYGNKTTNTYLHVFTPETLYNMNVKTCNSILKKSNEL